jgi:hypothetical protein
MLLTVPGPNLNDGVLTPWLNPMRAASEPMRRFSVRQSFLVHLLGLLLFIFGLGLFDQVFSEGDLRQDIVNSVLIDFVMALVYLVLFFVPIQLTFLVFAWLTTCWGAGVEPYGQSFKRSLSRWYQVTPWLAMIFLGLLLAHTAVEATRDWYRDTYDYARFGDYYEKNTQPMQLISPDRFYLLVDMGWYTAVGIANLLALWWVLGTVMVHRCKPAWPASCRWPAVCEGCGYALAGMTTEQTCPECGKKVSESTHADRDTRDTPSQRLLWRGLFRPSAIGASMATRRPTKMPLRVLLWGLLFTVLAGPVMNVMEFIGKWIREHIHADYSYGLFDEYADFGDILEKILIHGLTFGIFAAFMGSLLLLGAGTLVGTIVRVMGKRNIMPAACSAACYSAALLPAWVLTHGVQGIIIIPLAQHLRDIGRYDLIDLLPLLYLLIQGVFLLYMILHIARITKAARYANV